MMVYADLAALCEGNAFRDVPCPWCGPDRRDASNRKRRVLRVWHREPGFATYACARCGEKGYAREGGDKTEPRRWRRTAEAKPAGAILPSEIDAAQQQRIEQAASIWREAISLPGTLGSRYFTERRGLHIGALGDLSHALRFHGGLVAVVALMTAPTSGTPTGVHRTYLNRDATKLERRMLGKQGVVRLSPDQDVTLGLGITEGIEDGLAVLLSGWSPVWAACAAGALAKFPVLAGVEALTVFADDDETGIKTARACVEQWNTAGRDASIFPPKDTP